MVVESEQIAFSEWLQASLLLFAQTALGLLAIALLVGYTIAVFHHGPYAALRVTWKVISTGIVEVLGTSPRRVSALAWLAVKESIDRRVFVGFILFVIILLFAQWWLDPETKNPAKLYLSFVLSWTTYLVLLLALLIGSFSLPGDLKNRTLYTVVTKPVRSGEIVAGKFLGFTIVGTVILTAMGLISYLFVVRALDHGHVVTAGTVITSEEHGHHHEFDPATANSETTATTQLERGHWHEVTRDGDQFDVSGPQGVLTARVPVYGKLNFSDRNGQVRQKGISVGKEWTYRSYIAGGTQESANWIFEDVRESNFAGSDGRADGLPVALSQISVFRTTKGDIEKTVRGSLVLRNPDTNLTSQINPFYAQEFQLHEILLDRNQFDARPNREGLPEKIDLFKDLVTEDGRLEIRLYCEEYDQYFGVAQADLFLRHRDASFRFNFFKGFLGIWLQMVLVIGLAVMFSTFLSGPITMLTTVAAIIMGRFTDFVMELVNRQNYVAPPIEALVRVITHRNAMTEFDDSLPVTVMELADEVLLFFMRLMINLLPNFPQYGKIDYVANGFNVPGVMVAENLITAGAYLLVVFLVSFFFLKTREIAL